MQLYHGGLSTAPCKHREPSPTEELTLERVAQEQSDLLRELKQIDNPLASNDSPTVSESGQQLEVTKKKMLVIEANLKAISTTNQAERKRLADARSLLSQHTHSQEEFVAGSQSLRQQLLTLAVKQKQLLNCFTKQKQIGNQVRKLSSQRAKEKVTMSSQIKQPSTNDAHLDMGGDQPTCNTMAMTTTDHLSSAPRPQVLDQTFQTKNIPGSNHIELGTLPATSQTSSLLQKSTHFLQTKNSTTTLENSQLDACTQVHSQCSGTSLTSGTSSHPSLVDNSTRSLSLYSQQHSNVLKSSQSLSALKDLRAIPSKITPSMDLAHPVPLETLIKHGLIKPGVNCLSCVILVRLTIIVLPVCVNMKIVST